jgi:hypothetical protein
MPLTRNAAYNIAERIANVLPLADATVAYQHAALGLSSGRARPLQSGDTFAGFAGRRVDSRALATGAPPEQVPIIRSGEALLPIAGSVGASVYATADDTFSTAGGSYIGKVVRLEGAGSWVAFEAQSGCAVPGDGKTQIAGDLRSGRSTVLALVGDSTGNESWEHLVLTANALASRHPGLRVEYQTWDHATQDWAYQAPLADGSAGRLGVVGGTVCLPHGDVGEWTGADLDIRVLTTDATWATIPADSTLFSRFGNAGGRAFRFMVNSSGANVNLKLGWTADGTTEISVSATPWAVSAGETLWLRATLDADNGGGGYTVSFFSSADGVTWTARGQTATAAGATSVFKPAFQYEVGSRGNGSAIWRGSIHRVELRDGIGGPNMLPVNIDAWREIQGAAAAVFSGSQTLYVVNGSWSGQGITYFNDGTRRPRITPRMLGGAMILSTGHNEAQTLAAADVDAWIDYVLARCGGDVFWTMQNPRGAGGTRVSLQRTLVGQMAARARRKGLALIDVYRAYVEFGDPASLINVDLIHPSEQGQSVWSGVELAALLA